MRLNLARDQALLQLHRLNFFRLSFDEDGVYICGDFREYLSVTDHHCASGGSEQMYD